MRLASAQICHGTVNNCITWNGVHLVLLHGVMLLCLCVWVCGCVTSAPARRERRHVACFELLYICGWQTVCCQITANISTVGPATSTPLIPTHFPFPKHFLTTISHIHVCKCCLLLKFFGLLLFLKGLPQFTKTHLSYYLFIPFALLTHRGCTTTYRYPTHSCI